MTRKHWNSYPNLSVLLVGGFTDTKHGNAISNGIETPLDDQEDINVEEAAMALARATFARGGQLVFSSDPLLNQILPPLLREHMQPLPAEGGPQHDNPPIIDQRPTIVILSDSEQPNSELEDWEDLLGAGALHVKPFSSLSNMGVHTTVCIGGKGTELPKWAEKLGVAIHSVGSTGGTAENLAKNDEDAQRLELKLIERIKAQRVEMRYFAPRDELHDAVDQLFQEADKTYENLRFGSALYPVLMAAIIDEDYRKRAELG